MLNLGKDFKFFTIKTGENHSRIGILMIYISLFINCDGSCKPINDCKFIKCLTESLLKAHSIGNSRYNFCCSSITDNIFTYTGTAYCTKSIGIISSYSGRIRNSPGDFKPFPPVDVATASFPSRSIATQPTVPFLHWPVWLRILFFSGEFL